MSSIRGWLISGGSTSACTTRPRRATTTRGSKHACGPSSPPPWDSAVSNHTCVCFFLCPVYWSTHSAAYESEITTALHWVTQLRLTFAAQLYWSMQYDFACWMICYLPWHTIKKNPSKHVYMCSISDVYLYSLASSNNVSTRCFLVVSMHITRNPF